MGKLLPGVGGMDAPQYGRIAPLTTDDIGTVEMSKPALRCLRQTTPAAALLHSCARPTAPNPDLLADVVPGEMCFVYIIYMCIFMGMYALLRVLQSRLQLLLNLNACTALLNALFGASSQVWVATKPWSALCL